MKLNIYFLLILLFIFSGCATSHKMNLIEIGMTKQEVISLLGDPVSSSGTQSVEYLNYRFSETDDQAFYGITKPYFVRIINGKVDAYGQKGDFDSTKIPERKYILDINQK